MQTALPADFRRGLVLLLDGVPHVVEELHVSGTAKTKHKLHVQVRNLQNGHVFERVFPDNERVPTTELEIPEAISEARNIPAAAAPRSGVSV